MIVNRMKFSLGRGEGYMEGEKVFENTGRVNFGLHSRRI